MPTPRINPLTRKRLRRFRHRKRAFYSLCLLAVLYAISLLSEVLCNDRPLLLRYNGRSYFPVFRYYPADTFLHNNQFTRPDYKAIARTDAFANNDRNYMIFPPIPFGPYENIDPQSIPDSRHIHITLAPAPRVGTVNLDRDLLISRPLNAGFFFDATDPELDGARWSQSWPVTEELDRAMQQRFDNQPAPRRTIHLRHHTDPDRLIKVLLTAYQPRSRPPATVRLTLIEEETLALHRPHLLLYDDQGTLLRADPALLQTLTADQRESLARYARLAHSGTPPVHEEWDIAGVPHNLTVRPHTINWPHPPTSRHPLGIDSSGRDVRARILYGLRTSMTFGLLLVLCAMTFGTLLGAIQGYFAGKIDITMQRLTEIWSALPFLYIMILIGSVYGRGFAILLFCYALFNWIGISYYMRAEFLRLRKRPFIDAARCLGISTPRIMFHHILPNALTPIITFFPFSLVGAIGSLAALDFLGFGLPPPTPSWGELFHQAQTYRWAWWLILYPGLALFTVMLLGVFIGEGVRDAFDPKPHARIQ